MTFQCFDRFIPSGPATPFVHGMATVARAFSTMVDSVRFVSLLRWITPVTALLALALGLFLMAQPYSGAESILPYVMFAVGLGSLSVCVSIRWEERRSEPARTAPLSAAAPESLSSPVVSNAPVVSSGTLPSPRGGSGSGKPYGSEWRVLSDPMGPGDETWLGWLPRERRRLGAEGATLASGVVPSPGRAGNLVAFPVRDYRGAIPAGRGSAVRPDYGVAAAGGAPNDAGLGSSAESLPPEPIGEWPTGSGRASPYSVEELDRMFPPAPDERSRFLADAPQRVGGLAPPRAEAVTESPPQDAPEPVGSPSGGIEQPAQKGGSARGADGVAGGTRAFDLPLPNLAVEAANPIPPHLRTAGPIDRFGGVPGGGRRHGPPAPRSVCASCSKVVLNFRMSGPCPKCLRPVCDDCLRESFVNHGRGWCLDCSQLTSTAS